MKELLESKIPALEKLITVSSGIDVKGMLSINTSTLRNGTLYYEIQSESLQSMLNELTCQIFKDINIAFGASYHEPTKSFYFFPGVSYSHHIGGSNGVSFIWNSLIFDVETESWIPGTLLKKS